MRSPAEMDLLASWSLLSDGGGGDDLSVPSLPLDLDVGFGPVRLSRSADGHRQLLVPVGERHKLTEASDTEGISVRLQNLLRRGHLQRFVEVTCLRTDLDDVFVTVVREILQRLRAGAAINEALQHVIAEYRDLLRLRRQALTVEELVGLYGELVVLEDLLRVHRASVKCWTGPFGGRHDFSGQSFALEVKSTLIRASKTVHINGIEQLMPPASGSELGLMHLVLERAGTGGRTLVDLLESITALTDDPSRLAEALGGLGLQSCREARDFETHRFRVLSRITYRVDEGFPKLTPASLIHGCLPDGVSEIRYRLDLGFATAFRLNDAEATEALRGLAE